MSIATTTTRTTITRAPVTLQAPALSPLVDALLTLHERPDDKRARIQAALLRKEGLDECPCCSEALSVAGYEETHSPSRSRRGIRCQSCATLFVVDEELVA